MFKFFKRMVEHYRAGQHDFIDHGPRRFDRQMNLYMIESYDRLECKKCGIEIKKLLIFGTISEEDRKLKSTRCDLLMIEKVIRE